MNKKPISYLQTDPRWKNLPYRVKGETSTIGGSGCGPTSAAMLIETLTGRTYTPIDACTWSVIHGFKALNQGTYYGYFKPQFAAFGISCDMLNYVNTYGKPNHENHKKAFNLLKQGYYLIACMGPGTWTRSGHFVVVWWEDGRVRINDPASTREIRLNGDLNTFKSQVKYYWWIDARKYNLEQSPSEEKEEEDMTVIYPTLSDVPKWYKPTIQKLMKKKVLKGHSDPDPSQLDDNVLNISEDMCRVFTVLDTLGKLD